MFYSLRAATLGLSLCAAAFCAPSGAPIPAKDLTPGVSKYKATVQAGGQTLSMEITNEIKDQGDLWAATSMSETPVGEATDTELLEKGTLVLRERHIHQGPLAIDLVFAGNRATGKMAMAKSGETRQVNVDLGGPVFADSAGALESIAALPLADGYKAEFRNLDLRRQQPKIRDLIVVGSESVTVPAGTFDCWKVEVTSANDSTEKMTIWVAKNQPKAVKYMASSGQGQGGEVTAELLP